MLQVFNGAGSKNGRPGGIRTPNTRIWRPLLYRWSYWPIDVEGFNQQSQKTCLDFSFFVVGVLSATRTELRHFELVLLLSTVFRRGVIALFAHRALQRNERSVSFGHDLFFLGFSLKSSHINDISLRTTEGRPMSEPPFCVKH
jgi:hypothetical protein